MIRPEKSEPLQEVSSWPLLDLAAEQRFLSDTAGSLQQRPAFLLFHSGPAAHTTLPLHCLQQEVHKTYCEQNPRHVGTGPGYDTN